MMQMSRMHVAVPSFSLAAALTLFGPADPLAQSTTGDSGVDEAPAELVSRPAPLIQRASEIVGRDVDNSEQRLGEIRDVYLNPRGQVVYYVMVSGRSPFDSGETYAVPASCLLPDPKDKRFVLEIYEDKLTDQFEPFDPDQDDWPASAGTNWCPGLSEESMPSRPSQMLPASPSSTLAVVPAVAWKIDALLGNEITAPDGEKLGEIVDLGLDLNSSRIGFWVLELDTGTDQVAVPWEALSFYRTPVTDEEAEDEPTFRFVLEATEEELERAPRFDADDEESWKLSRQPDWLREQYDLYGLSWLLYEQNAVGRRPLPTRPGAGAPR